MIPREENMTPRSGRAPAPKRPRAGNAPGPAGPLPLPDTLEPKV